MSTRPWTVDRILAVAQATTGLAFASFSILHIGGHALAHLDIGLANAALLFSRKYYHIPAVELTAVFGSLSLHSAVSIARWWLRKPAVKNVNMPLAVKERSWHQTLGWVLLFPVGLHAYAARVEPFNILGANKAAALMDLYSASMVGNIVPFMLGFYIVMTAAACVHTAYGVGYSLQTLNIKLPMLPKWSRQAWFGVLGLFGASTALAVCGYYYPITYTPDAIEMSAYLHGGQGWFQNAISKAFGPQYVVMTPPHH
ncbi:hypothetical protein SeMB42_g06124 [Synchytrium endobioticum]|uniref:Mitochondrial adapter protein MCP1 transmembrane domain-containing protein n=1 Tax=Synchytrium endobioticum TaxID=286115 RepID=A0A507CMQ7_9FUNG|nr:hypothetical protein SeMB42_g06124 [Synchytrium endobioticum]TPX45532.1 hypothetical protein SeLEV6574_g03811 [Synchytrium endobioticum]